MRRSHRRHFSWLGGGVFQAGGLRHGEGIHVSAEEDPATVAIADDADDPAADLQDLVGTDLLELCGHLRCGPRFFVPYIRVAVEVLVELLLPRLDLVNPRRHVAELGRSDRGVRRGAAATSPVPFAPGSDGCRDPQAASTAAAARTPAPLRT